MKILQGLISLLKGDPVQKANDAIERVIHTKAELSSRHEFKRVMANFHTERVLEIDHTKDWWGYANHRQKQMDFQEDALMLEERIKEADARVQGYKAALGTLMVETNAIPSADA